MCMRFMPCPRTFRSHRHYALSRILAERYPAQILPSPVRRRQQSSPSHSRPHPTTKAGPPTQASLAHATPATPHPRPPPPPAGTAGPAVQRRRAPSAPLRRRLVPLLAAPGPGPGPPRRPLQARAGPGGGGGGGAGGGAGAGVRVLGARVSARRVVPPSEPPGPPLQTGTGPRVRGPSPGCVQCAWVRVSW
jgi:hypothetical protein